MKSQVTEAIVLAGGFGTRLQHVVSDVPKPMAPINNIPFLTILLDKLQNAGIKHVILSTGYKHETIANYFGSQYGSLKITYSQEFEPLFTGGAITLALSQVKSDNVFVLNGDTLFDIDFESFQTFHLTKKSGLSIALRPIADVERYGTVQTDKNQRVIGFCEKGKESGPGLINGGIYLINKALFIRNKFQPKFSFEQEVLEKLFTQEAFYGMEFNAYFIDIGIPEDYFKAQRDFASPAKKRFLFLDRDGVINRHLVDDYVKSLDDFEFIPGVLEALPKLARHFEKIIIVSNQQGIGKGLFSKTDLEQIHEFMCKQITSSGGRVDKIYVCSDLVETNSVNRKPNIGMAQQAQRDFPEIKFEESVMVGDSVSDLEFGRNAGIQTIFISKGEKIPATVTNFTPHIYTNLLAFANTL